MKDGRVARGGFDLTYALVGEGEPLLMLGGGPALTIDYLQPVADVLAETRQCILLHTRGTGRSPMPVTDETTTGLGLLIEDIEAVRQDLGRESLTIFGHSFGGMLAMAYAAAHPGRVEKLVLAASGGMDLGFAAYLGDNISVRLLPSERAMFAYWSDAARVAADPDRAWYEQRRACTAAYFFNQDLVPAFVDGLQALLNARAEQLIMGSLGTEGYDVREAMRSFPHPVLLVQGRQDVLGSGVAYENHTVFPNSTLTFLDRCGHFPWLEQPDAFFAAVLPFLA